MTTSLKAVFSMLSKMSAMEQNAIAALLNEELAWKASFEKSQEELSHLAKEAVAEYKKSKTKTVKLK